MSSASADAQALLHAQRRSYIHGALNLLLGVLFYCGVSGTWPPGLLAGELVLVVSLGALRWLVGVGWFTPTRVGLLGGVLGLVAATLLLVWSGGPISPYAHLFGAMPFMLALFTPGSSKPTLLSGGATLAVLSLVCWLSGMPPRQLVIQVFCSLVLLRVAYSGSRVYKQVLAAHGEAHEARSRVAEQLAESERLRSRAERERAEVERLVLVGQLAAGVVHEVNNPLAFVKANLGFLAHELDSEGPPLDREDLKSLIAETQQGVLRIQQIITDLKDLSRSGHLGEEQRGELGEALREAGRLASVRLGGDCQVDLRLEPELPAVRLGQRHMVQVMLNLLINAADAVEQALPPRRPHITVSARRVEADVRVLVEDNGPGIPAEVLPRLFEPFFTTKPPGKGTGLGLALCQEYIERAGGALHAENRAEGGARFVLRLPLAATSAPALMGAQ